MCAAGAGGSMVSQVVVDASAFYRLGLDELEAVAARATVLVSPVSLCEILSHLDEPGCGDEGGRGAERVRRDRLHKCDLLQTLCDQLAECAPFAGLSGALDELREGVVSAGATARVRRALDEARRAWARASLDFCGSLVAELGVEHALSLSGPEFVRFAASSVRALVRQARDLGVEVPAFEGAVFSSVYPFAGYRLARAQDHLRRSVGREPAPDPDDMEDAYLCRHLDLLEPRALVTADPGARAALDRALEQLATASAQVGAEVVTLARAMSVDELLRDFPVAGHA